MIFQQFKIGSGPVYHRSLPCLRTSRDIPAWLHCTHLLPGTVGFQIRLCHHIDAFPVTQIIPRNLIRIMAGTDTVDVMGMETVHIPPHLCLRDHSAAFCAPFMTVHSMKDQPFSIERHDSMIHGNPPEADLIRNDLHDLSPDIFYTDLQQIKEWIFMAPGTNVWNGLGWNLDMDFFSALYQNRSCTSNIIGSFFHDPPVDTSQLPCFICCRISCRNRQFHRKASCLSISLQHRLRPQIFHMKFWLCIQYHISENSRKTEKILIFQIRSCGMLVYLHSQNISFLPDPWSQVKI